jgi:aryl-alcohol dehydrogenase-like predicted oxidoreductase
MDRREFIQGTALAGLAAIRGSSGRAMAKTMEIPKRPLGKTGLQVSALGVGGYHLGSVSDDATATRLVHMAIDAGINFFDNAWDYHEGLSEERMGMALAGKRSDVVLMTKVCTHGRDKKVAMQMLEQSLTRLRTDHLDVWQIHEVIYDNDPDLIFAPNGAIEALDAAKQQGKVRFVGFTGHKDPDIHLKMLSHNYPFDTVQMPLNALDSGYERSFEKMVLPELLKRGIAPLGMKSMGGSGEIVFKGALTASDALRYAMSLPVAVTISGMERIEVLEQNLAVARGFEKLSDTQMAAIRKAAHAFAGDGRFELYKTTKKYDGDVGRQQHGFPAPEKLPA